MDQKTNHAPMFSDNEVSVKSWSYSELKTRQGKQGGQVFVNVNDNVRDAPRFQLPQGRVPFGARLPQQSDASYDNPPLNMEFSVKRKGQLSEWCAEVDQNNLNFVVEQSATLFPKAKNLTKDAIAAFYRNILQYPSNEEYDPLMRIKVKSTTNVYVVHNDEMVLGTTDDIKAGCEVVPIVRVSGLWFVSKNFCMTLTATDIVVFPKSKKRAADFNPASFLTKKVPKISESTTDIPNNDDVVIPYSVINDANDTDSDDAWAKKKSRGFQCL